MKLSIIIPTYKGCESLPIALQSIVEQTYHDIEVVISDDNGPGTDEQLETLRIVNKFSKKLNIEYLANEHVNGSHARNKGLEKASGDYISFLDDDDYLLKEYAKNVVESFNIHHNTDILFFDVAIITKEKVNKIVSNESITYKELLFGNKEIGTGSNICFRRRLLSNNFRFDERYLRHQDIEFMVKALSNHKTIWIKKLSIVKYFNNIDNYLDYTKSLNMQKLLRDDMEEHGLINDLEKNELENLQLHSLYHDMLARNCDKQDVDKIYSRIKDNNCLSIKDRILYFLYSLSKSLFNVFYRLAMHARTASSNIDFKEILEYRNILESKAK